MRTYPVFVEDFIDGVSNQLSMICQSIEEKMSHYNNDLTSTSQAEYYNCATLTIYFNFRKLTIEKFYA